MWRNDSIVGTTFHARAIGHAPDGLLTEVEGTAFRTGEHRFFLDPRDPLGTASSCDEHHRLDLTEYKALSFDCYGTLIDWEAGISAVIGPWAREEGLDLSDEELLLAYADNEADVERETPSALYPEVLAMAFRRTGENSAPQ